MKTGIAFCPYICCCAAPENNLPHALENSLVVAMISSAKITANRTEYHRQGRQNDACVLWERRKRVGTKQALRQPQKTASASLFLFSAWFLSLFPPIIPTETNYFTRFLVLYIYPKRAAAAEWRDKRQMPCFFFFFFLPDFLFSTRSSFTFFCCATSGLFMLLSAGFFQGLNAQELLNEQNSDRGGQRIVPLICLSFGRCQQKRDKPRAHQRLAYSNVLDSGALQMQDVRFLGL